MEFKLQFVITAIFISVGINYWLKYKWIMYGIVSEPLPEYDYIVVGGGTAGSVLARRIWEGTNGSVLLVEPGHLASWISAIPLIAPALQGTADWAYKTVPQQDSQFGMKDRQSAWPRGKALGGSSVLNYMLHVWGTRADFDELWSSLLGPGWKFSSVWKYFQRSEKYHGSNISDVRGTKGPMYVEDFEEESPLSNAFLEGVQSLGILKGDLNGQIEDGVMFSQSNIEYGWRKNTYDAYIEPVMDIANIQILATHIVSRLILHKNKSEGVEVINTLTEKIFTVRARREVILCAGVIGSPQLLMLSGIGPRNHLEKHMIRVARDLPGVGHNLRDHLNIPLYFHLDAPVSKTITKAKSPFEIYKYLIKGEGYFAHSGVEVVVRLPDDKNSTTNKMFFMLFNVGSVDEDLFLSIANFRSDVFRETFPDSNNPNKEGFIILASCTHPESTGYIQLRTKHPQDPPLIDPKYLTKSQDVRCLIEAMKTAAKLGQLKPLQKFGAKLHIPQYKDCQNFTPAIDNDKYLDCWIRMSGMTAYHPLGTCAMGSDNDSMAVLDNKFRVRGMKNLRVVDGSSFPYPIAGNPHAAVLMIAEKAADYIIDENRTI